MTTQKQFEVRVYIPPKDDNSSSKFLLLKAFYNFSDANDFFLKIWKKNTFIFEHLKPRSSEDIFFQYWLIEQDKYLDKYLYLVEAEVDNEEPRIYQDSVNWNNNDIKAFRMLYDSKKKKTYWNEDLNI